MQTTLARFNSGIRILCFATLAGFAALTPSAGAFTNPIYNPGADPFMIYTNGTYYMAGTDLIYNHIMTVYAASNLETMPSAAGVGVYNVGVFYESPELYWFGAPYNHWYIYYTYYPNTINVLESDTSNPQGTYHAKATLTSNTYDATLLQMPDGALYLLGSTGGSIVIQPMSNPYTTSGGQTAIVGSGQAFEPGEVEAPETLWHNGQVFLLYASGTYDSEAYVEGAMSFAGGDPTNPANWTELPGPVFQGTASNGNYGTAVCSPFLSPDGLQTWFVYAGYSSSDYTQERNIRAQQITWNANGTPNLGTPTPLGQAITDPSAVQPVAPANLSAIPGNGQNTLMWTTNAADLSYNVKRSTTNGGTYVTVTNITTTNYTDAGLNNGTSYYYEVSGVNNLGESTNSASVTATAITPPPPPAFVNILLDTFSVSVNTTNLNFDNNLRQSGIAAPINYLENVVNGTVIPGLFQLDAPAAPVWLQLQAPNPSGSASYGLSVLPDHNFVESTNFTVQFNTIAYSTGAHGGWGGVKILDSTGTPQFVNGGNGFGIYWNNAGVGQVFDGTSAIGTISGFPAFQNTQVELTVQTSDFAGSVGGSTIVNFSVNGVLNSTFTVAHSYSGNYLSLFYALPDSGTTNFCLYNDLEVRALLPALPILSVSQAGNQIKLAWPTNFTDGTLQWTAALPGSWTNASLTVATVGTNNVAYDTIGSGTKFYRLIR